MSTKILKFCILKAKILLNKYLKNALTTYEEVNDFMPLQIFSKCYLWWILFISSSYPAQCTNCYSVPKAGFFFFFFA